MHAYRLPREKQFQETRLMPVYYNKMIKIKNLKVCRDCSCTATKSKEIRPNTKAEDSDIEIIGTNTLSTFAS